MISPQLQLITVHSYVKETAPCEMRRGSAIADDEFAYFTPHNSTSVYRYQWSTEKWRELTPSLYWNSGLVIINGGLTAVGGFDGLHHTNKLLTLRQDRWVEHYPPMETARSSPAVVSTPDGNYILVIGGKVSIGSWTATVEILDMRNKKWLKKSFELEWILIWPSATICHNHVYVIGHDGYGYSCSLQILDRELSHSSKLIELAYRWVLGERSTFKDYHNSLFYNNPNSKFHWKPLPRQPVRWSTAATLSGQLIIVGGERDGSQVNSIHQLKAEEWVEVGYMSISRNGSLVVTPSPDKMMIVGGNGKEVEECVVV